MVRGSRRQPCGVGDVTECVLQASDTVVYDGSLAGLLSIVFEVFAGGLSAKRVVREHRYAPSMFGEPVRVASDPERARRVWTGLERFGGFDRELVLRCWLFDTTEADTDIVHLLVRLYREGEAAAVDFRDEAVFRCEVIRKKMFREIHRTHAFVRFAEAEDGLYFARIDPDFDVLPLAVEHFEDRYQDQEWMIWDGKRRYGYWFTPGQVRSVRVSEADFQAASAKTEGTQELVCPAAPPGAPPLPSAQAGHEDGYQRLWSTYFDSVNIAARANPRLHRAHVPLRYWRHLTEKQPERTAP